MSSQQQKEDLCDWWTRERIEAEDAVWQRDKYYVTYAIAIREFMRYYKLKSVIELGCGAGYIAHELNHEFQYTGLDGSGKMIQYAKEKFKEGYGYDFRIGNIRDLDEMGLKADLVCSFAVLKHFSLEEWKPILHQMLKVGRYGMIQVQTRSTGHPSVESGTDTIVGVPPIHHTWINDIALIDAVKEIGHEVIDLIPSGKDVSVYMDHASESLLLTKELS